MYDKISYHNIISKYDLSNDFEENFNPNVCTF